MSDIADRSDKIIEDTIAESLMLVRKELDRSLPAIGVCHWCESPVSAGRIFCSKECSEDYEHDRLRRKENGA